jgi:hypothetical protein
MRLRSAETDAARTNTKPAQLALQLIHTQQQATE